MAEYLVSLRPLSRIVFAWPTRVLFRNACFGCFGKKRAFRLTKKKIKFTGEEAH